ncbi:DUF1700 domain-containing protein [Sporosarcina aquimarina]|uniref:DUF1700 domain-containing protein n=1 Tax=Sporosarcina aquimarina TaxID=114975 RepID=UPI002040B33E|nr:DUF1700 domain-containing protein [Sporosarcina aquimarina]MCM3755871.1 DUF1700 domain-containing protein [Sporosarcina aquimarina]
MNKSKFMSELSIRLNTLPQHEINKSLAYYSEIIADRMEDGMCEEVAVSGLGDIDEIAQEIVLDATPISKFILPNRPLSSSDIFLLVLCSPLIILLIGIVILIYLSVWLVISALYLINISFVLVGLAGIVASIVDFRNNIPINILIFIVSLFSIGIGIVLYAPIKKGSKKLWGLTTLVIRYIKIKFIRKKD